MVYEFMWLVKNLRGGLNIMATDTWPKPSPPWLSKTLVKERRHKNSICKQIFCIFFVILLFIAAWTPFMVIKIVMFFCGHCVIPNKVTYVSKLLHYSNSAVNPLVSDGYRLPEFKRAFRFLIKSRKKLRFASLSFNQSSFEVRQLFNRQSKSSVKATHKHFETITAV